MNADRGRPRHEAGLAPVASTGQGQAWRDAVDRILGAWLLSGIDRAGLWETVMANAPPPPLTAVHSLDRPMTPGGPPRTAGVPDGAVQRQGGPWAGARAEVGERSGSPRE